jgi:hypothetical protein
LETLLNWMRKRPADVSLALFTLACLTGVVSLKWTLGDPGDEMIALARNIVAHGTFGNPFRVLATGPTAMNPPLYPLFLAVLIKTVRVPIVIYGVILLGSIVANGVTATLLPRVSTAFFGDNVPGLIASLLWISVMPAMPGWDVSYTVAILLFFCPLTSESIAHRPWAFKSAAVCGVLAGMLFLLNPSTMLIVVPWVAFLLWRERAGRLVPLRFAGVVLAVMAVFAMGWAARNRIELGAFVTRTNLGPTLDASDNDCAQPSLIQEELNGCYAAHHPNENLSEARLVLKIGEVQYDRLRIASTRAWIVTNPVQFLALTRRRWVDFWFPAVEYLPPDDPALHFVIVDVKRAFINYENRIAHTIWIITGISVLGLAVMAARRQPVVLFIVATLAVYPLLYYVVVADVRYRYPVLWITLLSCGYLVNEGLVLLRRGKTNERGISGTV